MSKGAILVCAVGESVLVETGGGASHQCRTSLLLVCVSCLQVPRRLTRRRFGLSLLVIGVIVMTCSVATLYSVLSRHDYDDYDNPGQLCYLHFGTGL